MNDNDLKILFEYIDEVVEKLNLCWFDLIAALEIYKHELLQRINAPEDEEIDPDDLTNL